MNGTDQMTFPPLPNQALRDLCTNSVRALNMSPCYRDFTAENDGALFADNFRLAL